MCYHYTTGQPARIRYRAGLAASNVNRAPPPRRRERVAAAVSQPRLEHSAAKRNAHQPGLLNEASDSPAGLREGHAPTRGGAERGTYAETALKSSESDSQCHDAIRTPQAP